jgi:hypothetical protein
MTEPCKTCGTCPTCGHNPYQVQPNYPNQWPSTPVDPYAPTTVPYPQPHWDFNATQTGTKL